MATGIRIGRHGFGVRVSAKWGGTDPHDRLIVEGSVGTLSGDILHYSNPSISSYVSKINYFSDLYLESRLKEKIQSWAACGGYLSSLLAISSGLTLFRLGFLDGFPWLLYRRLDLLLHPRPPHPPFGTQALQKAPPVPSRRISI